MTAQAAIYPRRIAFIAGGDGTALRATAFGIENGKLHSTINLVVSNSPENGAMTWAQQTDTPTLLMSGTDELDDRVCLETLAQHDIDLIVLTGYFRKIRPCIVDAYQHRLLNLHPALLPNYGGKGMYGERIHRAVLEAGEKKTGVTLHLVDCDYDTGPIVLQSAIRIGESDTPATLAKRLNALECMVLVSALYHLERGEMEI